MDLWNSTFGSLAEPYGSQLGERADGLSNFLFNGFYTGDERCADGAEPGNENAQLSGRCFDLDTFLYHGTSCEAVILATKGTKISKGFVLFCAFCG